MVRLNINLPGKSYPIYINTNFEDIVEAMKQSKINFNSKIVIITDSNVDSYYACEFTETLKKSGLIIFKYVIIAGEKSKSIDTATDIFRYLLSIHVDRGDTILALGGGVVGDIAGFVAATFLRGLNFIQVPTTLISQVDSSVGGKVGVNFADFKNVIGAFYQPKIVYINVNSLKTLPLRQIRSGMAEVIVHAIISDKDFFYYIRQNIDRILNFDTSVLQYLVKVNCGIKGRIVERDEKDNGIRAILNFGHTIGHAVETASNFALLHGECVSIGIVAAFKMAASLKMIKEEKVDEVKDLLKNVGLPIIAHDISVEKIYNFMLHDKKVRNGKSVFILPKEIGEVVIYQIDDYSLIKEAISGIVD